MIFLFPAKESLTILLEFLGNYENKYATLRVNLLSAVKIPRVRCAIYIKPKKKEEKSKVGPQLCLGIRLGGKQWISIVLEATYVPKLPQITKKIKIKMKKKQYSLASFPLAWLDWTNELTTVLSFACFFWVPTVRSQPPNFDGSRLQKKRNFPFSNFIDPKKKNKLPISIFHFRIFTDPEL